MPRRTTVAGLLIGLVVPVLPGTPAQAQEAVADPAAPTSVTAVPGDAQAAVSWQQPAGGAGPVSYTVTSEPPSDGCTAEAPTTRCTATGLANGTPYAFTVTVLDAAGATTASAPSPAVTPAAPPSPPTGVQAVAGYGSASLSWTAPQTDGGSPVTGYVATSSPDGVTCSTTTTGCTATGLAGGVTYTFSVTASNAVSTSSPSEASAPVTVLTPGAPDAPTAVTATAGPGAAEVRWTAPAVDGGSPVTGYTATSSPDGVSCTSTSSPCRVEGLADGTAYTFTVTATNALGTSAPSAPSDPVTPATVPGAPTSVRAVPGGGSAAVTWTAPASDGGSPVTGYTATSDPGGLTCTTSTTGCSVLGLTDGTPYTFTVRARNHVGEGPASLASDPVTPATAPDAPTGVTATRGDASVALTWTAPASDGGSPVTGYTATSSPDALTCTATTTGCTVTGLTNGTSYTFTVTATSGAGTSAPSQPSTAVTPATRPGAPPGVTAQPLDTAAVVTWGAASSGGSDVTEYVVTSAPDGRTCRTTGSTTCTVPGLLNGTPYTFTVVASNAVGQGPASEPSTAVVPAGAPFAPSDVTGVPGDRSVQVSWTAAGSNGSPLVRNVVTVVETGATVEVSGASTTALVDGLVNGSPHTFTVTAVNGVGSTTSAASSAVTPASTPLAPTDVAAERGDASAVVTWQPAPPNGSPVTGYAVVSTTDPSLGCTPTPATATSCTVTGLVNGSGYRFTVQASNALGAGTPSAASNEVVPAGVPTAPRSLQAQRLDGAVGVSWLPADGNGRNVEGYTATLQPGDVVRQLSAASTTTQFDGLVNGVDYTVSVTATNSVGTGPAAVVGPVTPAGRPVAPTDVTAEPGDRTATVTWSAADANGSPVTDYTATSSSGATCTTSALTCVVEGLTNGSSYTFTVTATNDVGTSDPSAPSSPVVPAGRPLAPLGVTADRGDSSATLAWQPADGNGRDVTGYRVASTTDPDVGCSTTTTTCTVGGLVNGQSYAFRVTASSVLGSGTPSDAVAVTPAGVPFAPPAVVAVRGDRSVALSWGDADGNGRPVTGYRVVSTTDPLVGCSPTPATATGCTVTGLVNGSSWSFTVTATNEVGQGLPSPATDAVVPAGLPSSPGAVTATRLDRSVRVTWTASSGNGVAVDRYTVTASPGGASVVVAGDVTTADVGGLVNGTAYVVTVVATNEVGEGPAGTSGSVTPAGVPLPPATVTAERGDQRAVVRWSAVADNGSPVTGYTVTRTDGGPGCTTQGSDADPLICTVGGLVNGTTYAFTVTATNDVGTSAASQPSAGVVPAGQPLPPATVTASSADRSAVLSWTAADGNGSPVSGYTAVSTTDSTLRCTTLGTDADPLGCTVTGLVNGVTYAFVVTATNDVSASDASTPSNDVVPAGLPAAPTAVSAERGDTAARVTWSAPSGNGRDLLDQTVTASPGGATTTVSGASTTATVSGLVNGTSYTFTVVARNEVGTGPLSAASGAVVPAGVPFAPTDVVATRGDTTATVTFSPPSGNGRPVLDQTVTSSPDGRTCTTAGTTCVVPGLVNGTSYTFTVVARNEVGTGAASLPSAAVVPAGVPFAPTAVTATRGDTTSAVSFTSPSGNGRPVLDHTVTATPGGRSCTTTGTGCTVTGLVNGTSYVFTVVARNEVGTGPTSEPSTAVVPAGLPRAPTGVAAVRGDQQATVSFTSPDGNGRDVLDHTVTSSPDGRTCTTAGTSCVVEGLVNGGSYVFTVVARTEIGTGSASAPSAAVVPAGVPFAPTGVTAARGNGSVALTWTAAAANGDAVTGYTATSSPHGRSCTTTTAAGCTVTGLTNGVAYTFTVRAANGVGTGPASQASAAVTPAGVPGAPRSVTAVAGDTDATVSWQAPFANGDPVTGYTVTSSPGGRTCSTTVALTCRVTGLANGVVHTFSVVATNAVGDSLPAVSPAVVPGGQPFPPTGVRAVRGDRAAVVTWTAADGNGRDVTGYTATSSPGGATCTATDAQGCTVSGLTNGTPYSFTVTATSSAGDSEPSAASSPVVPAARPDAPTGVTAVRGDAQVSVSWAPVADGGEPVVGHTVTAEPGGARCTTGTATGCTVTGLVNGTAYTFTVVATNAVGTGAASSPSAAVVPATLPSAPGTPTAVRGDGSAQVSWPAAEPGGEAVTAYTVTSSPLGRTCTTDGATTCTVTGLHNGTAHTFVVQARNAVGDGPASVPSAAVVPAGRPSAPTGVSAQPDNASAHVSWSAAADGGSAVTGYLVQSTPGTATCRTTTATVCTVPGLTNGTSYSFTVTATNDVGATTSAASTAVVPADVPSAPPSVSVTWHDSAATLTWSPSAAGGAAVTRYVVTTTVDDSGCATSGTSCRVEGLRNGTPYTFTVTAHNVMGAGPASPVTDAVVPAGVPLAATGVTAEPADRSATVRWTAAPDNGRELLSQTVRAVPSDRSADVVLEVAGASTSAVVPALENGTQYTFTVTATNSIGTGATSAPSAAVMPVASPSAPTSVTAVPGDRSALVSWDEADGNGVDVTGYTVTSSPDGVVCRTTTTQCAVSGLTNGRAYVFTVVAANDVGSGPASAPSDAVTPAGVPTAPTGVVAAPGNGTAQVSWTPAQANGSPLLGHTVRSTPGDLTCTSASASACTVTGLVNGTAYAFTVTATNAVGTGPASTASAPVVPATVPGATVSVAVVAGDGSAHVSWPAAPDGGSPITQYTVTSAPGSLRCATTGETACTVTGLTNGTSYRFTVVAANRLGAGPASAASAAVVPATTPAAPAGVRAVAGDGAAQVSWTAPADGGRPITGYLVTSSPGAATCRTNTATACTLTGLTNGTAYAFTVTATNALGAGASSAPSDAVTPSAGAPALPPAPADGPGPVAPAPAPGAPTSGPVARSIDAACPAGQVPASGFTDVAAGSTHARAIDCLVWWKVANGRTATSYAPSAGVTRDAMAAFVARTILAAKPGSLPAAPPNAFTDDDGSVHALAVDQLAAVGIVGGTGGGRYSPGAVVTRGQMARFLSGAVAHVLGTPLVAERDLFTDDAGSPFEADIDRVARVGITGGRTATTYDPTGPVLRDQMGSFLARTLDLFVERGASIPR